MNTFCLSIAGNDSQVTVFDLVNEMCTVEPEAGEDGPSPRTTGSPPPAQPPIPPETRTTGRPPLAQPPTPPETRAATSPLPPMQTPSGVRAAPMRGMKQLSEAKRVAGIGAKQLDRWQHLVVLPLLLEWANALAYALLLWFCCVCFGIFYV